MRPIAVDRRHQDRRAIATAFELRGETLQCQRDAADIDPEYGLPFRHVERRDSAPGRNDPGIRDEDIDTAERCGQFRHLLLCLWRTEVNGRAFPEIGQRWCRCDGLSQINHRNLRPGIGKALRDRASKAPCPAGDDGAAPGERPETFHSG